MRKRKADVDIRDSTQTEQPQQRPDELFRALIENALDIIIILDPEGVIRYGSPSIERVLGYVPASLVGAKAAKLLHPDDVSGVDEAIEAAVSHIGDPDRATVVEARVRHKDGSWRILEGIGKRLLGYPYVAGIVVNVRDVTERKQAEEARRQAEEKYRSLFENAVEGIFQGSPEGRFLTSNPALARMLGYSSPEDVISSIRDTRRQLWVDPERREEYVRLLEENGAVRGFECQLIRKDKSIIWVSLCARAVRDTEGKVFCYEGTAEEITERKRVEEALRESAAELKEAQRVAQLGSWSWIVNSDTVTWSEELYNIFGRDPELPAISYKDQSGFYTAESWTLLNKTVKLTLETGEPYELELEVLRTDGTTRRIVTRGAVIRDQNGRVIRLHGTAQDITEQKRLEAQFMQAQKMEAVGVLAGGVAHDFNNLLTVINGYSDFLLNDLARDDPRRDDLEQIKRAGQRAASLTSQLLAFSRKQVLQPRILDLNDEMLEASAILRRLIGEDIDLVAVPQSGLGLVKADPGQVQQIIMNLAVNARDAMPQGGKLTIETANANVDQNYVRKHPAGSIGRYVMLAISDNGMGMDGQTQSHVFEPFFTTKGPRKGTGLGLSTVYGIVKQSGGFIWVYSELGKGTTFKVYLPRVEGKADKFASYGMEELSLQGNETVLLVEDEPSMRTLATRILRAQGYTMLQASNGEEALRIAHEFTGKIHLVLTDVVMPEMSGNMMVSRLEAARPGIKVLFVSGYPKNAIVHHGVLNSNVAFLPKPFTADALARKVRKVLDSVT
jgi:PAS domain S-box-containing protein